MDGISRLFNSVTNCLWSLCSRKRENKDFTRSSLLQAVNSNNQRLLRSFGDCPDIVNRIVWREDFIRSIVVEKKDTMIPLIVYFFEETERALFMDISDNGRPVCQATGM